MYLHRAPSPKAQPEAIITIRRSTTKKGNYMQPTLFATVYEKLWQFKPKSSELEMHGYRARAIIPPSLNDLDLPAHPFNVFMTIPVAEAKQNELKTRKSSNLSLANISPLSLPSSNETKTTWTSVISVHQPSIHTRAHTTRLPRRQKESFHLGCLFPKVGECHSTRSTVRPAGRRSWEKTLPSKLILFKLMH